MTLKERYEQENPILKKGEIVIVPCNDACRGNDVNYVKIGDGVSAFNELKYGVTGSVSAIPIKKYYINNDSNIDMGGDMVGLLFEDEECTIYATSATVKNAVENNFSNINIYFNGDGANGIFLPITYMDIDGLPFLSIMLEGALKMLTCHDILDMLN